jgi:hypothetical protein
MSAPPRGPHAGGTMSGRPTLPPGSRGRGPGRGNTSAQLRGRGGRGRDAASTMNPKAEGLLQGLQTGSLNKRGESSGARAHRGESTLSMPCRHLGVCPRLSLGKHALLSQIKADYFFSLLTEERSFFCPTRRCAINARSQHAAERRKRSLRSVHKFERSCKPLS